MRDEKLFTVYLMTNKPRGVFYVGVSSNLVGRMGQHRAGTSMASAPNGGFAA